MKNRGVIFSLLCLFSCHHTATAAAVGDEVCITGYIMDHLCIESRYLLDNSNVLTLQHPEEHSFHCLLDYSPCYKSGFQVLGQKDPATGLHALGFRIGNSDAVIAAGRAVGRKGYCYTCKGTADTDPAYGYQATVRGRIQDLGDGSDGVAGTPLLTDIEMLDASVGCDGTPTGLRSSTTEPTVSPITSSLSPTYFPSSTTETTVSPTTSSLSPTYFPSSTTETTVSPITSSLSPTSKPTNSPMSSPTSKPQSPVAASVPGATQTTQNLRSSGSHKLQTGFILAVISSTCFLHIQF